ncbi:unnamed protein product [Cuscuta europaea]|uniref:Uncharacterized protein n=1 Tax=Cuscuta europaea TaxID=41803 RepID=A0A9P1E2X2_CUSEU|nr:unnamed protein product [Cuscuta europaea]
MTHPPSLVIKVAPLITCSLPTPPIPVVRSGQSMDPAKLNIEFPGDFCRLENALQLRNEMSQMLLPSAKSAFRGSLLLRCFLLCLNSPSSQLGCRGAHTRPGKITCRV